MSELVVMVEEKKEAVEVEEGVEEVRKTPGSRRRKKRPEKKEVDTLTASVTTSKTTLGHSATVEARDIGYKVSGDSQCDDKQNNTGPQRHSGSQGHRV